MWIGNVSAYLSSNLWLSFPEVTNISLMMSGYGVSTLDSSFHPMGLYMLLRKPAQVVDS